MPAAIDVAHRFGSKRLNESRPRAVIVRFMVRRYREAVWKAAKNCPFLRDHGLHFNEDLTKDRDSRQKLWPLIKKAREESKSAYFVGGRGFIDGVELYKKHKHVVVHLKIEICYSMLMKVAKRNYPLVVAFRLFLQGKTAN